MVCLETTWNLGAILQCLYYGQTRVFRERDVDSCGYDIRGGVRQGCVLSPRLFSAVLEMALSSWRVKMEAEGLSLEDGLKPLLDLRFADGILVFSTTLDKACLLLDELVASLAEVRLKLNVKVTLHVPLAAKMQCSHLLFWLLQEVCATRNITPHAPLMLFLLRTTCL